MGYSNKDYLKRSKERNPQISFGIFLIVLGLALLVATNDMLHLGSVKEYFTWQTVMIFIGVLLLLNLNFIPGLLLIAGGLWFFLMIILKKSLILSRLFLAFSYNTNRLIIHYIIIFKRKVNSKAANIKIYNYGNK